MKISKSLLFCLILVLAGCEKAPEQAATENTTEKPARTDTPVELSGKDVTISGETDEGEFTISSRESTEIPKDFPDDVYIYRPSRILTTMDMPDGGVIALTTPDNTPTIANTYKREMTDRGWSEQTSVQDGARLILGFEKEERSTHITIGSMDDASQIMLTVSKN